jgi:hypothetical protein
MIPFGSRKFPWTPSKLFGRTDPWIWIDPSDLSTMFQDTAGTIPVTASGQSVALIKDKSGNGYNLTQATAASQPTFQQDANGKRSLLFDGVNDYMDSPSFASVFAQPTYLCTGFKVTTVPSSGGWYLYGSVAGNPNQALLEVSSTKFIYYAGSTFVNTSVAADTAAHVATITYNGASSSFRMDGASVATGNPGSQGFSSLRLGSTGALSVYAAASIYGIVLADNSFVAEQAPLETWMGRKCGLSL